MSELVIHADTAILPVSEKHVVKSMYSLHVILFHNFVATSCKDSKLVIC